MIAEQTRVSLGVMLSIPDNFDVFLTHGGPEMQHSALCYNLLGQQTKIAYASVSNKEAEIENNAKEISRVFIDNLTEVLQKKPDDLINAQNKSRTSLTRVRQQRSL